MKLLNKKRGRTYESGIAVTEDTKGSGQPPATKKCNHCGLTDHLRRTNARCPFNNSNTRAPPPLFQGVQHAETTGTSTDLTDASNTRGSSMAGIILQDRDTAADLEQVSKFNSTNQNMCSDAGTHPGVFSDRELFSKTCLRKTLSLRERFCTY